MATVRFEPSGVEVEDVTTGTRLVDLTDDYPQVGVPYSCRAATCGMCRVEVIEGSQALAAPEEDEEDLLEIFGDEPGVRLCCQLTLERDARQVLLRVVDPD